MSKHKKRKDIIVSRKLFSADKIKPYIISVPHYIIEAEGHFLSPWLVNEAATWLVWVELTGDLKTVLER